MPTLIEVVGWTQIASQLVLIGLARRVGMTLSDFPRWQIVWLAFGLGFTCMLAARVISIFQVYGYDWPWLQPVRITTIPLLVNLFLAIAMWYLARMLGRITPMTSLIGTSEVAHISVTIDSVVTSWDSGAETIFGYWASEAVGRPLTELIIPEGMVDAHLAGLAHYQNVDITSPRRRLYPVRAQHRDGTEFPVMVEINIVPQPDGTRIFAGTVTRLVPQ